MERVPPGCKVTAFPDVDSGGGSVVGSLPSGPPGFGPTRPPPERIYDAEMISPEGVRYAVESPDASYFGFTNSTNESIWTAGNWTFRNLSPTTFSLTVTARRQFRWKAEPDFANYSRERDLVLEWDPTLGDSNDTVTFVYGQFSDRAVNGIIGHEVVCGAPMNAGKLVVPASLMRAIQWVPSPFGPYLSTWHYLHPTTFRTPDGRYVQVTY